MKQTTAPTAEQICEVRKVKCENCKYYVNNFCELTELHPHHPEDGCIYGIERRKKPDADVVKVVRCKDCKYNEHCSHCITKLGIQKKIDFCSYGERSKNEDGENRNNI